MCVCMCIWAYRILYDWTKFWSVAKYAMNLKWSFLPSPASSMFFGCPHRSSMIRLLSAALRSCSFFNSSAAFFLNNSYKASVNEEQILLTRTEKKKQKSNSTPTMKPYPSTRPSTLPVAFFYAPISYTEFLLSVRSHETLLGLLCLGRFFHTFAHFGPFAVDFRLFRLLSLHNL